MKNKFEIRGDVTAIFLNSPKYGSKEALISTKDLSKMDEYLGTWYPHWYENAKKFYCMGTVRNSYGEYKTLSIHRFIMNAPDAYFVDHINHDTLNNTQDNLRILTNAENQQNRKGAARNSSSGVRGVTWRKTSNKWQSMIKINGKNKYLGLHEDIIDAEAAVISARAKYMPYSTN